MRNINILINEDHTVSFENDYAGLNKENLQGNIIFSFKNFVNGQARAEIVVDGEDGYILLDKVGQTYTMPIKSSLLKGDFILMQLVIDQAQVNEEYPVWKSECFTLKVGYSINATNEIPDDYPSWVEVLNGLISDTQTAITQAERLNITSEQLTDGVKVVTTDKNGNEYVATVQCDRYNNDYQVLIFKKDGNGNFQQISSKKMQTTHGNSLTTKYDQETGKVEIYTTKKYTDKDLDGVGDKSVKHDTKKISRFELDLNDNNITDEEVIDINRKYTGSVSIDSDNDLYATSTGYKLRVSQGDFTNQTTKYELQGAEGLTHQSGCIHGNMFYKVMWDRKNNKNYLFTYDLTKKNADGKVPYTSKIIDSGPKREIQDISWDENLGLIVSINNLYTKENGRSTEYIKV